MSGFKRLVSSIASTTIVVLAGCQGESFPMVPVEGVVVKAGQPMANMLVEFYPERESKVFGPRSTAVTDDAGRFRLRTDKGEEGAVVGKHRVGLFDLEYSERTIPLPPNHPILVKNKGKGPPIKRVGSEYRDYFQTPLRSEATPPSSNVTIEVK